MFILIKLWRKLQKKEMKLIYESWFPNWKNQLLWAYHGGKRRLCFRCYWLLKKWEKLILQVSRKYRKEYLRRKRQIKSKTTFVLNTRACDWFWQSCLSSTWTKLPVYKCGTEGPDTHTILRFVNNFVFQAWAHCGRQLFVEMEKVCFLIYSALLVLVGAIYVKSDAGKHYL